MNFKRLSAVALAGALVLAACGDDDDDAADTTAAAPTTAAAAETTMAAEEPGDIVAVASAAGDFSTLVAAVEAAGLVETLQGPGPFTVFAPTDDAFAALPDGVLDALLLPENKAVLTEILTYHVVPGQVLAADVQAGDVTTVQGDPITITTDGGVKVNDANVVATDVLASNGVIHVIDAVLLPPDVDPAALLEGGEEEMGSETTMAAEEPGDIVAVASSTEGFSTLVAAVQAAGLVETLQGPGPFTVFAPTDEAFAALPDGVLDALLLPENKDVLTQILTYHVLPAEVLAADVTAGEVATVEGDPITITTDGGVKVNDANVIATDVKASNGVIHVIDAVLLPPGVDPGSLL